jgi:hypothetical protein
LQVSAWHPDKTIYKRTSFATIVHEHTVKDCQSGGCRMYKTKHCTLYTLITRRFQVCLPEIHLQIMLFQSTRTGEEIPHQTVAAKDVAVPTRHKNLTVYSRVRCSSMHFYQQLLCSERVCYSRFHQCRALLDSNGQFNFITKCLPQNLRLIWYKKYVLTGNFNNVASEKNTV